MELNRKKAMDQAVVPPLAAAGAAGAAGFGIGAAASKSKMTSSPVMPAKTSTMNNSPDFDSPDAIS